MNTRLRVLLVAESSAGAEPMLAELRRAGLDLCPEVVRTAEEMERALGERTWDLVLSDSENVEFDGVQALALLRERGLDVPLLCVASQDGEIGAEAGDLPPRSSLPKLAARVERELGEARLKRERRSGSRALRESEARLHAVAEAAAEAILATDADGIVLFANRAAERVFGHPIPAMIGRPLLRLVPGFVAPEAFEGASEGGGEPAVPAAARVQTGLHASGREIPLEISVARLVRDGRLLWAIAARDVTEHRGAQDALRESEARQNAMLESALDAIVTIDSEGRVLEFNRAAETIFGYSRSHAVGRRMADLIVPPSLREQHRRGMQRYFSTGETHVLGKRLEMTAMRADGSEFPIELTVTRLPLDGPAVFTGSIRDISDRKRAEDALRESEERFRVAAESSSDLIYEWDIEKGTLIWFGDIDGKLGYGPGEFPRTLEAWERCLHAEDHDRIMASVDRHRKTGKRFVEEYRVRRKDGRLLVWTDSGMVLPSPRGTPSRWIGVCNDVTERRRAEQALRASEVRYRTLFERNLAGVFRSTRDGRILDCNESFARTFGYSSPAEVLRHPARDFYLRPEDREVFLARLAERQSLSNYEMCVRRRDGTPIWVLENATMIEGPDGVRSLIEGTVIDISERKRAEEQVKHLAFHDPLTSLPNRLLFNDRLTMALAQAHRSRQRLATLFLDLDRFKVINDSLGHAVGDELLRRVAERLQACVREGDTVARLGGDEFILLIPRISDEKDAVTVARKILTAVRLPFAVEDRDLFLTTSIGVSVYPGDGVDAETLVQNADTALYRAKEQGRDNYQLYAPAMNARAIERLSLENRLQQALQNDELVLHYQPIVDLRTGRIRGAEALLRWQHPELGLLPPAEFITLAEISGLIFPIGRWVLETACQQIRDWQAMGYPKLTVSVNISPKQFQQAELVSQVTGALAISRIDATSLDVEITESNAMQNAELTINTLWELRRLGVGISMDDFGTGYSSLNYLKRFPIDRVKLDQSFVRDVAANSEDAAIVRAVIAMAHTLRLVVAAEGVENREQLRFLQQHHCDEMQGFLFSPPVGAREFERLMRRRQALPAIA